MTDVSARVLRGHPSCPGIWGHGGVDCLVSCAVDSAGQSIDQEVHFTFHAISRKDKGQRERWVWGLAGWRPVRALRSLSDKCYSKEEHEARRTRGSVSRTEVLSQLSSKRQGSAICPALWSDFVILRAVPLPDHHDAATLHPTAARQPRCGRGSAPRHANPHRPT